MDKKPQLFDYKHIEVFICTQGGNRTRTPKNRILNPARLPIPPLELLNWIPKVNKINDLKQLKLCAL